MASEVAAALNLRLIGADVKIERLAAITELRDASMSFANTFRADYLKIIKGVPNSLVICSPEYAEKIHTTHLLSGNPRLAFLRAAKHFFYVHPHPQIHPSSIVDPTAKLGRDISIGPGTVIESGVTIGDRTELRSNVIIKSGVTIGADCLIKSNAVLGEEGFGYEIDEHGVPEHFPHFGTVCLDDGVHIGSGTAVDRATLGTTKICKNAKIDNLVHIAHNAVIGQNTLVIAGSVVCGGAVLGRNCWLAPNSVIKEGVRVGDFSMVGLGAVVVKNVPEQVLVVGVPAKILRSLA